MRIIAAFVLASLAAAPGRAGEAFTDKQLAAQFPFDLGAAEVDVSAYPKKQQDNYGVFARTCSQCHTLARPINSPWSSRKDWKRYISRMHLKTRSVKGTSFSKKDARVILDFLVFDSGVRKVEGKAVFERKAAELETLFAKVKKARSRRQLESDRKKVKKNPMPQGAVPQP